MKDLQVGLIGFGLAGKVFHAPAIRGVPGLRLACVLMRSGSITEPGFQNLRVVRTLDELLADQDIELCVIATPNSSHFELASRCLEAGRHVVVDKPFTTTVAEARELISLAEKKQRVLTVFQSRRWDGDFQTVRNLVQSGELGRITEYESRYDRFRPSPREGAWREGEEPGGGVLFDLGPHLIDQALMLFGMPQAVTARLLIQREHSRVDDAFDVSLEYPLFRATLRARMLARASGPHFTIHGSEGSFIKYGMDPQEEFLRWRDIPAGTAWESSWGEDPEANWGTLTMADGTSRKIKTEIGDYRGFYASLRETLVNGAPLAVTPQQALNTMIAIELARRSDRERCSIPWGTN